MNALAIHAFVVYATHMFLVHSNVHVHQVLLVPFFKDIILHKIINFKDLLANTVKLTFNHVNHKIHV